MPKAAELARGRWPGILAEFGIDRRFLSKRHGACILCGGKDRARFRDYQGRGTFFCNQCRSYDGFEVIMRTTGMPFAEVAKAIEERAGEIPAAEARPQISLEHSRRLMGQRWGEARSIEPGDPVHLWLHRRLGPDFEFDDTMLGALRYHPRMPFWQDGREIGSFPCMLARVVRPEDGKSTQVHRTYLTQDGRKAFAGGARALMAGTLPAGSYVPLGHPDEALGVAEGIETALAASMISGIPVQAALSAGNLEAWTPPATVKRVVVFGDNDASFTGQAAAYRLAKRLKQEEAQGRLQCTVEVLIPDQPGDDWNRVLVAGR